jgi:hypothetical protein
MKFSMTGQEKGDLIQVTAWAGLTVYKFLYILKKSCKNIRIFQRKIMMKYVKLHYDITS